MTVLGRYTEGFASWRRILGTVPPEAQLKVFGNAVEEVASFIAHGLDRAAAADELVDMATSIGFEDPDLVQEVIARAFSRIVVNGPEHVSDDWNDYQTTTTTFFETRRGGNGSAAPRHASKYDSIDPAMIPRRAWLYAGHYTRHTVSATFAPGGFGKTTLQLFEAIKMVQEGVRVWYLSGEDPKVELDRRIAAHCELHHVVLTECSGQLFVDDVLSWPLSIAASPRPGAAVVFDEKALHAVAQAITLDRIDVVILDPLISFHAINENDNSGMGAMIKRLAGIATEVNCSIELGHHVRKGTAGAFRTEINVDDARGGSAILGAVRSARVINRMTAIEAEQADIDKSKKNFFVRVDIGKRNMAPPPEKATWYRLVNVPIANGDQVQALTPWSFPSLMEKVSVDDSDWVRDLVKAKAYRADSRSSEWLGIPIAKRLKLNVMEKSDVLKIQRLIGIWLANDVFAKQEMRAEDRKMRMFYVPASPPTSEPGNVVPFAPRDNGDGE